MPVGERRQGPLIHALGWFVDTVPIEFRAAEDQDFPETLALGRDAFAETLRCADFPFVKAWELLSPESFSLRGWPFPVNSFSYLDFRKCPGAENHSAWRPNMHVWASGSNGIFFWFHRNTTGLHVNTIFADTRKSRPAVTSLRRSLKATVEQVARTGSF